MTQIISNASEMQQTAIELRAAGKRIGLVPTMGALHEGHLSLIRQIREHSDVIILSIFVNPIQFGPGEDFSQYPRTFDEDVEKCKAEGVDIIFAPEPSSFYPSDFSTYVTEEFASEGLCGTSRPGHFRGVTTVVAKLFNTCCPAVAIFGKKDAQQLAVIRRMVRDLNFPIKIIGAPIVREEDGLAMSSRNRYLSAKQRSDATAIIKALKRARTMTQQGILNTDRIISEVTHMINDTLNARVIYVVIVSPDTMKPLKEVIPGKSLIATAVSFDRVRLIDNYDL